MTLLQVLEWVTHRLRGHDEVDGKGMCQHWDRGRQGTGVNNSHAKFTLSTPELRRWDLFIP